MAKRKRRRKTVLPPVVLDNDADIRLRVDAKVALEELLTRAGEALKALDESTVSGVIKTPRQQHIIYHLLAGVFIPPLIMDAVPADIGNRHDSLLSALGLKRVALLWSVWLIRKGSPDARLNEICAVIGNQFGSVDWWNPATVSSLREVLDSWPQPPARGKPKSPELRVWTKPHCPNCGELGVEWLPQKEFAARANLHRQTVSNRIKAGRYCHDRSGRVPWCPQRSCRKRTPDGYGAECPVDVVEPGAWQPTHDNQMDALIWAAPLVRRLGLRPIEITEDVLSRDMRARDEEAFEFASKFGLVFFGILD